ncbi:hypothetical protein [Mesorhizobium ventifaucium]|uniref:PFL domain-containing protein n=1 Tax=Mesorhizobium ventifaucium TaxID=666020 RepID=A0ABN8JRU8_9HYPH|nr:hypothetical protein [Mesorhizobium ventifaucium]CAH2399821.1 hypothetical protein MES4922_220075 [Mesorhizobium ventifaucium]
MPSNIERYQKDLERLVRQGGKLTLSMQRLYEKEIPSITDMSEDELKKLPDFHSAYQGWYSESLALISQILPERMDDFRAYYSPKTARKEILWSNYTISDALRGTSVGRGGNILAEPKHGINPMYQQYNMVAGLLGRFASTLYDIKTLLHADLLDDELEQAEILNKNGFQRGPAPWPEWCWRDTCRQFATATRFLPKRKILQFSTLTMR